MSAALDILGVPIDDCRLDDALARVERWMREPDGRTRTVYFVNANTLNLACEEPAYREILRQADVVYGDGTGVRWAARMLHGVQLRDNVNGTDFVPRMFASRAGRGYRYYLLGATEEMNARAAAHARAAFAGWELVGRHHGYLDAAASEKVVEQINEARPHVLLVGMGNPAQERWIHAHRDRLRIPVCVAIGGLFAYWSGDLDRAPRWLRAIGFEWVHLLVRQPRKVGRYLLGNPLFLWRVLAHRRARTASTR
ncbi:MAG: glycosyltransferase [Proteobacteria bacterium]|nr:MAG: glycosyltransferase [Pseudomonadota bacterium]